MSKSIRLHTYSRDILLNYEGLIDLESYDVYIVLNELCQWLSSYDEDWSNPTYTPQYRKSIALMYMTEILISKSNNYLYAYVLGLLSKFLIDIRYEGWNEEVIHTPSCMVLN